MWETLGGPTDISKIVFSGHLEIEADSWRLQVNSGKLVWRRQLAGSLQRLAVEEMLGKERQMRDLVSVISLLSKQRDDPTGTGEFRKTHKIKYLIQLGIALVNTLKQIISQ